MAHKKQAKPSALAEALGLDQVNELLTNERKLYWMNIKVGMLRGFGGVLGAAIALLLIGFLIAKFGGLPYIGEFLHKLGAASGL